MSLRFFDIQQRLAAIHHAAIAFAIPFGLRPGPGHVKVALADELLHFVEADRLQKLSVTSQVLAFSIFPEHEVRNIRENVRQDVVLFFQLLLRLRQSADIGEGFQQTGTIVQRNRRDGPQHRHERAVGPLDELLGGLDLFAVVEDATSMRLGRTQEPLAALADNLIA